MDSGQKQLSEFLAKIFFAYLNIKDITHGETSILMISGPICEMLEIRTTILGRLLFRKLGKSNLQKVSYDNETTMMTRVTISTC
jgi:hypothetical protein